MPTLNECANAVLAEFGFMPSESICSFEDAKREFLQTRALELQKLGVADSNKTVTSAKLVVASRTGSLVLPDNAGDPDIIPAAVEFQPTGSTTRQKVVIVEVDDIPGFENDRAIAFFDNPLKYRLAWDSWTYGDLYLYYDPVEDMSAIAGGDTLTFSLAFWTLLTKKTALALCSMIHLKLTWLAREEERAQTAYVGSRASQTPPLLGALAAVEQKLMMQVQEWDREFRRFINKDLGQGPYKRRTQMEINGRGYLDVSDRKWDLWE